MARPPKIGLEWFPLDTNLDDKMQFVEATHGIKGYAIVIKLLQKIYGHFGYFGEWNARTATLFANELRLPLKVVTDVVGTCVEEGIFHEGMFEKYGILTSAGIQRRYLAAVRKRTDASIKSEYALAELAQKELWTEETPISASETPVSATESTQKENNINKKNNIPPTPLIVEELITVHHLNTEQAELTAKRFVLYNELNGWKYADRWQTLLELFLLHSAKNGVCTTEDTPPTPQKRVQGKKTATTRTTAQTFDVEQFFADAIERSYSS